MTSPSERVHRLAVFVDGVGQTCGASLVTDYGTPEERVRAMEPGPFDSPQEVLERLLGMVDIQMRLWSPSE